MLALKGGVKNSGFGPKFLMGPQSGHLSRLPLSPFSLK